MAVISREELTYSFLVEQYFLALKGRGLVTSATDRSLIRKWESRGAPVWVVCEAIREAFDSYGRRHGDGARSPSSLRYCRRAVERALKSWEDSRVGSQEPS